MSNKTEPIALVTGASGGIGKSIAEMLAVNGFYVFAAARSMDKLEAMRTSQIEPLQLPGVIDTGFEDVAVSTLDKSNEPAAYTQMVDTFRQSVRDSYKNAPGPELVANTVLKAVRAASPKARYRVGRDAKLLITARHTLGDGLFDRMIGSQY